MRISILTKLIILLVSLSIGPIGLLGYVSINDFEQMGDSSKAYIEATGDMAIRDCEVSMNQLGETIIQNKAEAVAKQIEVYLLSHPDKTVKDLQADPYFTSLAIQDVGKTGYTSVAEVETQICRFHVSDSMKNKDLHFYESGLPKLWDTLKKAKGGHDAKGYYDWVEEDKTVKQKYMHVAIVDVPTADGIFFTAMATTYIDEFSEPINQIRENINASVASVNDELKEKTSYILIRNLIAISIIIVVIGIVGSLFAYSIVKPIREFTFIAEQVSQGELENAEIRTTSGDELGELGESLKRLITSMKYYMEKI